MPKHGGVREDAYVEDINLAYKLEDGMKIHIPTKQEKEETKKEDASQKRTEDYVTTSSGIGDEDNSQGVGEVSNSSQTQKNAKVNINTATATELETLPGIGPSTANKIMAYRKEKGKFSTIDDIKEVGGIGEAKFNKIKDLICVK